MARARAASDAEIANAFHILCVRDDDPIALEPDGAVAIAALQNRDPHYQCLNPDEFSRRWAELAAKEIQRLENERIEEEKDRYR